MNRTIEGLAGERLLVNAAVGATIEEAADNGLELIDHRWRVADERVGELLVVDELSTLERVGEMFVQGISRIENGVVPALHHARAAAFANQPFGSKDDAQARIRPCRVERREQP